MNDRDLMGARYEEVIVPAHAAATATEAFPVFARPYATRLRAVTVTMGSNCNGAATNCTNINLLLHNGTGAAEMNHFDMNAANAANSFVAYTARTLHANATAPDAIAANYVLAVQLEKAGDGIAVPAFKVRIEWDRAVTS
jgi:hypothetical protein